MAQAWKAILPSKFRLAAFKAATAITGRDIANDIKADFEKTTATWNHKPNFTVKKKGIFGLNVTVSTTDQIYIWVNDGTRARTTTGLTPISVGFEPKTTPGVIGSKSGSKGTLIYRWNVRHPGSEARKFDEAIKEKWEDKLVVEFQKALDAGAIASGHSIGIGGRTL